MREIIKDRIEKIEQNIAPEGYKKTKIGIIPEDWQVKKLEKFTKKMNVGFVGTCESFYVEKDKGIPMIRTGNIKDKKINLENLKYVDKEFHEKNKKSHIKKGDLLLSRHGFNGQTAIYNLNEEVNCLNIIIITPDLNVDNYFLYYQLNSDMIKREILSKTGGSTQKVVNLTDIKKLNIPIPPMEEQERIAEILTTWDEYIESLDILIEKKQEMKKGLMQKLLTGEKRLPGHTQPWQKVKINNLFDKITRGNVLATSKTKKEKIEDYIYPVYSSQTLNNGLMGYYNEYLFENAITWTTDGANAGTVNFRKEKFYCTNVCGVLLSKKGYANKCISEILNLISYKYVSHVGNPKLMNNIMKEIIINIPPSLDEQKAIADILSMADEEIDLLKKLRDLKKEEKKGLMQLLLTGIVRV